MWEFIVSGQLPGTTIAITFEDWLIGMACLLALTAIVRYHALSRLLARLRIALLSLYAGLLIGAEIRHLRDAPGR